MTAEISDDVVRLFAAVGPHGRIARRDREPVRRRSGRGGDLGGLRHAPGRAARRRAGRPAHPQRLRRIPHRLVSRLRRAPLAALAILLMLLGAGCSSDSPGSADAATPAPGRRHRRVDGLRRRCARRSLLAAGRGHARQRHLAGRGVDVPHRRDAAGGADPAPHRLRGHTDPRRRHALSLHAARQGLRPRSRHRHRALAVRRAGQSPDALRRLHQPRGVGVARSRRRRGRAVPSPHLPRGDGRAADRARCPDRPDVRRLRRAGDGESPDRTPQPAAVRRRVRDDLTAGRRQRRRRDRIERRRQRPDRPGQRRGPRLRRAHRRAALVVGSDPARGRPIRRGRPGTDRWPTPPAPPTRGRRSPPIPSATWS